MAGSLPDKIRDAGVIGAGGAGFPAHIKVDAQVDTVIANGAECEPLLRVDQQVMARYAREIVEAVGLVMDQTGADRGIIALKKKYKTALARLEEAAAVYGGGRVTVSGMNNYYPAGDEQVLVYDMTGRVVPEGGIPLMAGTVVSNVHSLLQIRQAADGVPVTWRYVTVGGAVRKPGTFRVPIGTPFSDLTALAGGAAIPGYRLLTGGPMMGAVHDGDEGFVDKTTSGLIVLPADHYVITSKTSDLSRSVKLAQSACCQCTYCTQACPRNLLGHSIEPHKVMRAVAFGIADAALVKHALYCVSCGVCTYYACPMGIDPYRLCTQMKNELMKQGIKPSPEKKEYRAREYAADRKIPVPLLVSKLNLDRYDVPAPLDEHLHRPARVRIRLNQHVGAPAKPAVAAGAAVTAGTVIAEPGAKVSARYHASIDGKVTAVTDTHIEISKA